MKQPTFFEGVGVALAAALVLSLSSCILLPVRIAPGIEGTVVDGARGEPLAVRRRPGPAAPGRRAILEGPGVASCPDRLPAGSRHGHRIGRNRQ